MPSPEQPLRRPDVLEKHVDEILERRLKEDKAFTITILGTVLKQANTPVVFTRLKVARQAPHKGTSGTIDLLVRLFDDQTDETGRILIENKLDSSFTPTQPERYCSSAIAMSRTGRPAVSVICAPETYLSRSKYLSAFKAKISYEEIRDLIDGSDQRVINAALLRFAMPYEPNPIPEVRDFHEGYAELAAEIAPELQVKPNPNTRGERPEASRTIYFVTRKTLPQYDFLPTLRFSHQCLDSSAPSPSVKVMFDGWGQHEALLRRLAEDSLGNTLFYLRKAGRSLGLVRDTPKLDNKCPISIQHDATVLGIRAAAALRAWMYANESTLREWAQAVASAEA